MANPDALSGETLVDVYLDGRLIATCPVAAHPAAPIALAKQMLRDDGVMSGEALDRAQFRVRPAPRRARR